MKSGSKDFMSSDHFLKGALQVADVEGAFDI